MHSTPQVLDKQRFVSISDLELMCWLITLGLSIRLLFGDGCRGDTFVHDKDMKVVADELEKTRKSQLSQLSQLTSEVGDGTHLSSPILPPSLQPPRDVPPVAAGRETPTDTPTSLHSKSSVHVDSDVLDLTSDIDSQESIRLKLHPNDSRARVDAFLQMRAHARGEEYEPISLLSTTDNIGDVELGKC